MIEASFEHNADRSAVVSGAYQYDTGQRLRMHGLPSPRELAEADDFLSGEMVTVQVHFGFKGESQTEARLALWDEAEYCYVTSIPDAYLQKDECVYAYVYVSYGLDEAGNGRTKTLYELTMRPISRPAPNNMATDAQWEAWAAKAEEMELALDDVEKAAQDAQAADSLAQEAEQAAREAKDDALTAQKQAQDAAQQMQSVEKRWAQMNVNAVSLPAGEAATATLSGNTLTLGLPRGEAGAKGETGDTGPADISLSLSGGVLTIGLNT